MRTIRASELGAFLFCRRAWWYQVNGAVSANQADLARGISFHHRHGRSVLLAGLLRSAGWLLLLAALVVLAVGLTMRALN